MNAIIENVGPRSRKRRKISFQNTVHPFAAAAKMVKWKELHAESHSIHAAYAPRRKCPKKGLEAALENSRKIEKELSAQQENC
jgi:hypothetical protein